jgi:hypothetical protein
MHKDNDMKTIPASRGDTSLKNLSINPILKRLLMSTAVFLAGLVVLQSTVSTYDDSVLNDRFLSCITSLRDLELNGLEMNAGKKHMLSMSMAESVVSMSAEQKNYSPSQSSFFNSLCRKVFSEQLHHPDLFLTLDPAYRATEMKAWSSARSAFETANMAEGTANFAATEPNPIQSAQQ